MTPYAEGSDHWHFATVITLFFGYLLTLGGYNNVPLFGSCEPTVGRTGTRSHWQ